MNLRRCRAGQRPRRGLHGIRHHDDGRFLRLRLWTGIPKVSLYHILILGIRRLSRLLVKIRHEPGAVVLGYQVPDPLGQADLLRQFEAVFHVAGNDQAAHVRRKRLVLVDSEHLVLHEILRFEHLAQVVIIRADSHKQRVGANGFGRRLGQGSDHKTVVIGARGFYRQSSKNWRIEVGQLQQAYVGCYFEYRL